MPISGSLSFNFVKSTVESRNAHKMVCPVVNGGQNSFSVRHELSISIKYLTSNNVMLLFIQNNCMGGVRLILGQIIAAIK